MEPGRDGKCAGILYIAGYSPSWKTLPCNYRISLNWVCKRKQRRNHDVPVDYSSFICCKNCLMIYGSCYFPSIQFKAYQHGFSPDIAQYYVSKILCLMTMYFAKRIFVNQSHCSRLFRTGPTYTFNQINVFHGDALEDRNSYDPTNTMYLYFRNMSTHIPACGPQMHTCVDGTCTIQSLMCDFNPKCSPKACGCEINGSTVLDHRFCRTLCQYPHCVCPFSMFHCSIGGCVPYSLVCDGEAQCRDSSDEFCRGRSISAVVSKAKSAVDLQLRDTEQSVQWCLGFKCVTGLCIDYNLMNDLIPDCHDARDEDHSLQIKHWGSIYVCKDKNKIPCVPNHSHCFEMHLLCVYDNDHLGHLYPCRNGAHLLSCSWLNCTNTFKCPESYCIPIRKVCDGIPDCINGDDEIDCGINICQGYLKCLGVQFCLHPLEVCDGTSHCPHSDDEMLCDVTQCPWGCICARHSALCRNDGLSFIPEIRTRNMRYLSVGFTGMHTSNFSNLSALSSVYTIDLSHSGILDICPAFQSIYSFYGMLYVLYLQQNKISYLSDNCFGQLTSLIVINLQYNKLHHIADETFLKLSLYFLIIKNTCINHISSYWLQQMKELHNINAEGLVLKYISSTEALAIREMEMLISDDRRLCCLFQNIPNCPKAQQNVKCLPLLFNTKVGPLLCFLGCASLGITGVAFWLNVKFISSYQPAQFLLNCSLVMSSLLCATYLIALASVGMAFGHHYIIRASSWKKSPLCRVMSGILSFGLCVSNLASSMLHYSAYIAVSKIVSSIGKSRKLNLIHILGIVFIAAILTITLASHGGPFSDLGPFCTGFSTGTQQNINMIIFSTFLGLITMTTFVHTIVMNIGIFKTVFASGKALQAFSPSYFERHKKRSFRMFKRVLQSIVFKALECLPILSLIFLYPSERPTADYWELICLLTSTTTVAMWNPFFFVCNPLWKTHIKKTPT